MIVTEAEDFGSKVVKLSVELSFHETVIDLGGSNFTLTCGYPGSSA